MVEAPTASSGREPLESDAAQLLWDWYQEQAPLRNHSRDFHLFGVPAFLPELPGDCILLVHAPSCRHFRLGALLAACLQLSLAPPTLAEPLILQLTERYEEPALREGLAAHAGLLSRLAELTTPVPAVDEPAARKGELLMYGNLACNMACGYCSSRHMRAEAAAGRLPRLMPLETAYQSIRFIAERMRGAADHVYINFSLGGEPLLSFERYRHLREYCAAVAEELSLPITLNFNTNGTVVSPQFLEDAERNGVQMAVSLDGPRDIHDALRPLASGKGSYDAIVAALAQLQASPCPGLFDVTAGAVLTASHPHPRRVYEHLLDLGCRHVVVTPVRDDAEHPWSLNSETVAAFQQGYSEYADWLLERLGAADDRAYAALNEHDFFGRYLLRLLRGTKQGYRCQAGRTTFGVGVDGGLYPCDNFIRLEEFRLGDVYRGIDPEKQAAFLRHTAVDEKPVCKDCWARYQCGGGCYFTSVLANGDPRIPHAAKCDLIRHLVELAVWLLGELAARSPLALARLREAVRRADSPALTPVPADQLPSVP